MRHASWNEVGMLDWLQEMEIGLCNIDQPLFHRSIKPGAEMTSSAGYGSTDEIIRTGSRRTLSRTSDMTICTRLMNLSRGLTG